MEYKDKLKTKRPTLILHIGTCKTGTSALQMCLAKNQKFLIENKTCYSEFHESNNFHLNLTLALIREYFEKNNIQNGSPVDIPIGSIPITSALYSQTPADITDRMKHSFYENNCDTMVISDECLFESTIWWIFPRSLNTEHLLNGRRNYIMRYFKDAFKEFDIKIVCYLRRQDDYIESLYNQWTKGMDAELYNVIFNNPSSDGSKYKIGKDNAPNIHMAKFVNGMLNVDYYAILSGWAELYGKENIIVRTYEKSRLPKGIEYDFFTNILGGDDDSLANMKLYEEVNASFKKDIIEYKMAARLFDLPSEIYDLNDSPALAYLSRNNKKNILKAKQAEEILENYKESNERIATEYLHRTDGVLFYDKKREEKDDYQGLSVQAAIDISRELILRLK
ncbi:MAG: hypothetical protein FWD71_15870 [Oscillospiraceae bacterium]|nr:hypothetical protein [Oscillospiraceae bacterium]